MRDPRSKPPTSPGSPPSSSPEAPTGQRHRLLWALGEELGPAILLDARLRVVDWNPQAEALVGTPIAEGVSAASLLCSDRVDRPLAEALAAGQPVTATIPRPLPGAAGERWVRVRARPLREDGDGIGGADEGAGGGQEPARPEGTGAPRGVLLRLAEDPRFPPAGRRSPDEVTSDSEAGAGTVGPATERWGMLTRDPAMKRLFRDIAKVAASDAAVLVRGETGSGKELVARAVHQASPRADGPFRAINCAALPATLLESELFGHVRGAYTGAVKDTPGHFRLAQGGTLFLDEVGELPLEVQAKLLRVLEERTVIPVGGAEAVPIDVRIVAATHRALRREVRAGRFRADLLYRVRVLPVFLPSLRERPDDIVLLAERFVARWNEAPGPRGPIEAISPAAANALERYGWPGNVRELQNAIEFALVMGEGPVLEPSDLPPEIRDPTAEADESTALQELDAAAGDDAGDAGQPEGTGPGAVASKAGAPSAERAAALPQEARRIVQALAHAGGHHGRAAASLGISRTTLWRRIRQHGLR